MRINKYKRAVRVWYAQRPNYLYHLSNSQINEFLLALQNTISFILCAKLTHTHTKTVNRKSDVMMAHNI